MAIVQVHDSQLLNELDDVADMGDCLLLYELVEFALLESLERLERLSATVGLRS